MLIAMVMLANSVANMLFLNVLIGRPSIGLLFLLGKIIALFSINRAPVKLDLLVFLSFLMAFQKGFL